MSFHSHRELQDAKYVVYFDSDRQYVDCSEPVVELLGYGHKAIVKKTIDDLSYWKNDVPALFKDFLRNGHHEGEHIVRQERGAPVPIYYRAYAFSDGCKGSTIEVLDDWRARYLEVSTEADHRKVARRVDVALAAIYQRIYGHNAADLEPEHERAVIFQAISKLNSLRREAGSALSPELIAVRNARSSLLRLSDQLDDAEARRLLLDDNRVLVRASIRYWFAEGTTSNFWLPLVNRVAHKARYYDPDEDPILWLHNCIEMECRRLKTENGLWENEIRP
jgi:hypothetical protein